ncbi:hypothetical protein RB195_015484 [Necator americanus]|uniref:Uncharacterized protein n=1 Tax=Necator americanus TaxID=51031 RepID=A0ABR1E5F9_NECAM
MEAAAGTESGPSQTAAMGGSYKGFTTLLSATLYRSASREAPYAIAAIAESERPEAERSCVNGCARSGAFGLAAPIAVRPSLGLQSEWS